MAAALFRHEEMPENPSAPRVHSYLPTRRPRILVLQSYGGPKHSLLLLNPVASSQSVELTPVFINEIGPFNTSAMKCGHPRRRTPTIFEKAITSVFYYDCEW